MAEPNLKRIKRDILRLADMTSKKEAGFTRISFSDQDRMAREYIGDLMEREAGLKVRIDPAGNLIGRRKGKKAGPGILLGSHLDTVSGGGRFDGIAGVIAGLEVARMFEKTEKETRHPLEVVVFLAEEPSPFGLSTIGSRAMAGKLSEDLLGALHDDKGTSLGQAILKMGGDPSKIHEAKRTPDDVLSFLELHVEQGPLLYSHGEIIGIVTGISAIYRGEVTVCGSFDHAGTTPMNVRKDALAAASEAILGLEKICLNIPGVVGTTGRMTVIPNAINVVPGSVSLKLDLRSTSVSKAEEAVHQFEEVLEHIRQKRAMDIQSKIEISSNPIMFDNGMIGCIRDACKSLNIPYREMASGAGHDTSHMAEIGPSGMVFIPSRDGKSHCAEEWSEFEHICLGTKVLAKAIDFIDHEEVCR